MKQAHPSGRGDEHGGSRVIPFFSTDIHPESIKAELNKILASPSFAHSERHSRFLRFTVENALKGQGEQLKEYLLGVEVFDRGESFDPRIDSIVRTEATRLRSKLKEYYEKEGLDDPVVIEFSKGGYCPHFRKRKADVVRDVLPSVSDLSPSVSKEKRKTIQLSVLLTTALLLGLIGGVWRWQFREKSPPANPLQHLVSTFPGSHQSASFSPDGSMIAFIKTVDGSPQLWVKNLAQGDPIQITSGDLPAHRPRWSPRNDQIIFALSHGATSPSQGLQSIWTVPPLGGSPRKVIEDGRNPSWSWDGARLAFERRDQIWTANADGTGQHKVDGVPSIDTLLADRMPSFSPDGTLIAFFQPENGPSGDFWIIPSSGGQARRLTFDVSVGNSPIWTPDGRFIVFSSERAGSMTLWKIPVSGGSPQPVLVSAGADTDPEISDDGKKLIYTTARDTFVLTVLNPLTGRTRVLRESRGWLGGASYSPTGEKISFFSHENEGEKHVSIIDADGANLTAVAKGRGERNIFPQWSPDGLTLYFYQERPTISFRKIGLDGGPSSEVVLGWTWETHHGAEVDPNGELIVYTRQSKGRRTAAKIRDPKTGNEATLNLPLLRPRWSSDGKLIVGTDLTLSKTREGDIAICPAGGGPCQQLTTGYHPRWSRDDSRIYFLRSGKLTDGAELWSISREGRDEKWMANLRPLYPIMHQYDVSPKGEIVYVQFKPGRQELWLMDLQSH